jgi:hypothetical protein
VSKLGRRGKSFGSLLFDADAVLDIGGVVAGVVVETGDNGCAVSGSFSSGPTWESVGEGR